MNKFISVIFIFFLFISCNSNEDLSPGEKEEEETNVAVFPVTDFLKGQVKQIENSPVTPLKIMNVNGKIDSIWVTRDSIRTFIAPFLKPEIDSASLTPYFDGTSFLDQTVNAITLTYEANSKRPASMNLKHMDIYIDPVQNTITRIYLVKESGNNDSTKTLQMTWKTDNYCLIRSILQTKKEEPVIREEKMIWAFN